MTGGDVGRLTPTSSGLCLKLVSFLQRRWGTTQFCTTVFVHPLVCSEAVSPRDKLCHQQRRSGLLRWQTSAARPKDETRPLERHAIASASAIWPSKPTSVARTGSDRRTP